VHLHGPALDQKHLQAKKIKGKQRQLNQQGEITTTYGNTSQHRM
jgi:hypothetical protein